MNEDMTHMRAKQPSGGPAGAVRETADARARSWLFWGVSAALAAAAFCVVFWDGLVFMAEHWDTEEYSHGSLIPIIAAFLIWQKKDALETTLRDSAGHGAVAGFCVVLFGLFLGMLGELSTVYLIIQYGFLVVIGGLALVLVGWRGIFLIWAPLLYLVFMVPLPSFLYANLSAELQLISSQLGVAVIRLFDIPVFLEGNVIDLGIYKLQVVEACSGLRYLFPLMSFGYLCAYLYRGPVWHRAVLFLSTIPITILMNSLRIGVIGVLVDRWGIEQAEGALHLFEGWVVFMACVAILFCEIVILARLNGRATGSLRNAFRIDLPDWQRGWLPRGGGVSPRAWIASVTLLTVAAVASVSLLGRENTLPPRESLAAFPLRIDDWYGQRRTIAPGILGTLKLTDYLLRDYIAPHEPTGINLYIAYYASQRKGEAVHSPRSCIPGDGWRIEALSKTVVNGLPSRSGKMAVNRAIIAKGNLRQVVYYWFDQRGREMTNEYRVKWFLFWDGLTRNRTDGALIRLVTPLGRDEAPTAADKRLAGFVQAIYPELERYVPS
jgi:exosortase D (VPLPA-CTERM-specific)